MLFDDLQHTLHAIRPVPLGDAGLQPWLTDEAITRLLHEAALQRIPPSCLYLHGLWEPLYCHANAPHPTLMNVALSGGVAYLGFVVVDRKWWCHSWWTDGHCWLDPCLKHPEAFWGMAWDVDLFRVLYGPEEELPAVLTKVRSEPHAPMILTKGRQHEDAFDSDHALTSCNDPREP